MRWPELPERTDQGLPPDNDLMVLRASSPEVIWGELPSAPLQPLPPAFKAANSLGAQFLKLSWIFENCYSKKIVWIFENCYSKKIVTRELRPAKSVTATPR